MKKSLFKNMTMEDIHQKILDSIKNSDEFDDELQSAFVSIILDMFIHKNNGLQFFFDYYEPNKFDMEFFIQQPLIDYIGGKDES
jgi:hypothetical protein